MTETLWNRKRELCEEILETLKVTKFYNWLMYTIAQARVAACIIVV